ncbi:MAG: hypothetical protein AMXMBFR13_16980 [Phycisphaerae bacterium]
MDASTLPFVPKYPRSSHLSNDGCCIEDSDLNAILSKADAELDWRDYCALFTISRCTGTYEELCYFLPWALRYILNDAPDAHESITSVIHFISEEAEHLAADGLLDACQKTLRERFAGWTSAFVVHHVEGCCNRFGRRMDYADHVDNTDFVGELIGNLVSRPAVAGWGEMLLASLADSRESPVQSAWFLELMSRAMEEYEYFDSGEWVEDQKRLLGKTVEDILMEHVTKASAALASVKGGTAEEWVARISDTLGPALGEIRPAHKTA